MESMEIAEKIKTRKSVRNETRTGPGFIEAAG
jgi:hypothetical protein